MSELTTEKRNSFDNSVFGIPELRKYPLNDKEHVLKAIQFFHHCPLQYKKKLAHNINKEAKKYNISISQNSVVYEYLNEEIQLEIQLYEAIYDLENCLYLNEMYGMNEAEARGSVDTAISLWKKRKKFIRTDSDKMKILNDLKSEKAAINAMQNRGDYNGILLRAKATAKTMNQKLSTGDYNTIKYIKGKGQYTGNNSVFNNLNKARKIGWNANIAVVGGAAAIAGGAAAGGALAKKKANINGDNKILTGAKTVAGGATGAVVGGAAAAGGALALASHVKKKQMAVNDPEKPMRQYAEKYANFINNFQAEMLDFNPQENNPDFKNQFNNQEGED